MFKKMLVFLRAWMRQMFGEDTAAPELALSSGMENAIALWADMYETGGPWTRKDTACSIGLPSAIAAEFARLVTVEAAITFTGARADFMEKALSPALDKLRQHMEYCCALGGGILKPYVSGDTLCIDFVQGDGFVPTEFDASGRMTGAVFCDQIVKRRGTYTRLEHHSLSAGTYLVENSAFFSSGSQTLGRQIPLTEVPQWAQLSPHAEITGIDAPLFAYLRVPGANPTDRKSPLGVSVYSRAVHLIQDADQQYGRLLWEFEGGELAIDAAEDVLRQTEGGDARLPKTKDRLFRRLSSSGRDFYEVFSPALRDASLKNGLDIILKRIEFTCALAYGTLSDPQNVDKTAEEVRSSKQRSYAAVRDIQNALQHALDDLLYAAGKYADIYGLAPAGDCVAAYDWGDSITDKDKEREQMRQDCRDHAAQWWEYRMRFYGEDETTAKKNAGAADAELDPFQLDDPRKNLAGN